LTLIPPEKPLPSFLFFVQLGSSFVDAGRLVVRVSQKRFKTFGEGETLNLRTVFPASKHGYSLWGGKALHNLQPSGAPGKV
jgi:hypothetical protein